MATMTLPRSSPWHRAPGHHKLLTEVDVHAPPGLQFRGQLLTPGARFEVDDLPRPAVLLECAGSMRTAAQRSRYAFETVWVLWRFDFAELIWVEVARMLSNDASWTVDLAPIAWRLLHQGRQTQSEDRAAPIGERLAAVIQLELEALTRELRCYVLAGLDRYIANEIVRATEPLSVSRIDRGPGAPVFPRLGIHVPGNAGELRPRV